MMCECRVLCLLMALMVALDSSLAFILDGDDVNPICKTTTETLIAHPTQCAQYYNCSAPAMRVHRTTLEKNLQECDYPQLYNPATQRCEHYSTVSCGNRTEPLGKCEYARYTCLGGRDCGAPCHINNPTCRNFADGLNVYEHRPNSPYYVECLNQRLVKTGVCPACAGTGAPIFDAQLRQCVCK